MRRIGEDLPAPALGVEGAVDETVAEPGGSFRLFIMDQAEMIAGDVKALAVELAGPAFDRNLPVGVAVKKAADDADADLLAWSGWWR